MRLPRHSSILACVCVGAFAFAFGAVSLPGCSLALTQDGNQCKVDTDCTKLGGAHACVAGVCVVRAATGGGGGSGGSDGAGTGGSDGAGTGGSESAGSGGSDSAGNGGASGTTAGGSGGASGDGGKSGSGGGPCSVPAPTCPDNLCLPFDNCTRLGLCDGASLPALVAPTKP